MVASTASIPFLVLSLGLLAVALTTMLVRGDLLLRVALMAVALVTLPWAVGMTVSFSLPVQAHAERALRLATGTVSLIGPALLFLVLALTGILERYRHVVALAGMLALSSCIVTWSTDLVVAGTWQGPGGLFHVQAGPLNELHLCNVLVCCGLSAYLARRDLSPQHEPVHLRHILIGCTLIALGCIDGLFLHHRIGIYPLSVFPSLVAVVGALVIIFRSDLLRSRGFDWTSVYELGIMAALILLVVGVSLAIFPGGHGSAFLAIILLVPLFGGAQAMVLLIRDHILSERRRISQEADLALDEFFAYVSIEFRTSAELGAELAKLIEGNTQLADVRMLIGDRTGKLRPIDATSPNDFVLVEPSLGVWLIENQEPLVSGDLPSRRLGRLRKRAEALLAALGADVIMPLVDRGSLVGMIAATQPQGGGALHDEELELVQEAARTTAKTLTYIDLFREAEARISLANELEVAAAVQHARTPGEERRQYRTCEIVAHYYPAAQFGGDWWMAHELPDGRVVVVTGDVTGRGVPAALVSSTVASACQTGYSMLGASLDPLTLMHLLGDAVKAIGGEKYAMGCFAAIIDVAAGKSSFVNAGHPFPYRCRRVTPDDTKAALTPLVSRGTRLGAPEQVLRAATIDIADGDVLVFFSDAVVDAINAEGRRYGERRLQSLLKRCAISAGERVGEIIVSDVMSYCGAGSPSDDMTLVVVRIGVPDDTPR